MGGFGRVDATRAMARVALPRGDVCGFRPPRDLRIFYPSGWRIFVLEGRYRQDFKFVK